MKFKSDIEVQAGLKDSSGAIGTSGQLLSSTATGVSWTSQSGFVPYTGATQDVNLGIHQLKADSLAVSTSSLETVDAGEIVWNAIDGTFDMGLIGGVTLQAGQEMHMYGKATEAISNGQAVMFAGVQGDHILIAKADAATINANPEYFIGVATQNFAINDFGYVTVFGNVRGLDTTAYTLGSVLYYDSTTATDGLLTATEPTAPNAKIIVAAVVRVHATQGILLVRPHVMPKLNDVQDVYAPSPSDKNGLFWNNTNSRYENNSIAGILGYTPANDSNVVKLTGVQTIEGIKTFSESTKFDYGVYLKQDGITASFPGYTTIDGTTNGYVVSNGDGRTAFFNLANVTSLGYTYPSTSGTFALTSDLHSPVTIGTANGLSLSGQQLSLGLASSTLNGALSSTDWNTFNNKQAAGNYITSLTGEVTASGPGSASATLNNASVTGKTLSGVNITGGTILDTDTMLTAFGKLQNQINSLIGGSIYQGVWNASTNTPTLTSSVGTDGNYYIVNVAGSTDLNGITDWKVGDWAIFHGGTWQKVDNTDAVSSVNGFTGAVSLTTDNIAEGVTNQYFLNSRARAALSFAAGSGAYNSTTGVITIPTNNNQITNGSNFITLASLSGSAPIQYNNTTGAISITQAGASSNGFLSSTDWNTFNNKQNTITNPIRGSGTINFLPKFTQSGSIGNSQIFDNGTIVGIGTPSPSTALLHLNYNSVNNRALRMQDQNGIFDIITSGASQNHSFGLYDDTNGEYRLFVLNNGYVGIGTTSPSAKLQVEDSSIPTAAVFKGGGGGAYSTFNIMTLGANDNGYWRAPTIGSNIKMVSNAPAINVTGFSASAITFGADANQGRIGFFTTSSNTGDALLAESLRINTTGNVLINTKTDAGFRLDVNGTGRFSSNVRVNGLLVTDDRLYIPGNLPIANWLSSSLTAGHSSTNSYSWLNGAGNLVLGTDGSERMRITSGGNVGIAVQNPADRFQVVGTIAKLTLSGVDGVFDNVIKYGFPSDLNSGDSRVNRWIGIDATVTAGAAITNTLRVRAYGGGGGNAAPVNVVDFRGDLSTLFYGNVTAVGFFNSSDIRLKELTPYDYSVSDIKPISYLWKDGRDDKKHIGYSAQEVQKVMPDAVNEGTDGMLSVNYIEVLVAKISELENRIKQLEK